MPRIFISYRRSDSEVFAGRIYDRLAEAFGSESVFMDVEGIQPGTNWRGKLRQAVTDSNVLLVLIGSTWLDTLKSRQSDPDDWVRYEIQMGLENDGTLVIPVLLQDTRMPSKSDLPDVIEDLVDSQSIKVRSGSDFRRDMDELITFLRGLDQPASTLSTQAQPTNAKSRIRTEVLVAIITGIFAVIAAAIGILPNLLNQQPAPTSAAVISTLTHTPQPLTETLTSTPAPTSTDTPQPSDTPTDTPQPATQTSTPTPSPTGTPQPSSTPTTTPNPPTNTPVPATPTTPAPSGDTITLTIFRDQDSLTLYMPKTDQPLSLAGLVFQVEITGQNRQFPLIGYSSFGGNSILGNVSILNSAACFRLARSGSRSPAPLECQNGALPLTQNVADADVFWYDSTANQHRTVLVLRDGGTITVCAAGQTTCDVGLPLVTDTQMVNVAASMTATPGYPCEGTIGASQSSIRNIVRSDPVSTASIIAGVAPGTQVLILEARQEGTKTRWYRIGYEPDTPIGWIRYDYLDLSPACPQ